MDALPCKDTPDGHRDLRAYSNDASKLAQLWGSTALANVLNTTVWQRCTKILEWVQVSECRVVGCAFRVED